MSYDEQQGERVVRESERCLLAESCLLYQFATRQQELPLTTFYCPAAERLFREALGADPILDFVLDMLTPLANCYRLSENGEWIDG